MNQPQYVVFDMGQELQVFRNKLADIDMQHRLVDVWQIQRDIFEAVLKGCEDWRESYVKMCANLLFLLGKYVHDQFFDERINFYTTCTELAALLHKKIERHWLHAGGEFHYKFEKFDRQGLVVLSLNWDNTARAA
jgi:hypothetical protein